MAKKETPKEFNKTILQNSPQISNSNLTFICIFIIYYLSYLSCIPASRNRAKLSANIEKWNLHCNLPLTAISLVIIFKWETTWFLNFSNFCTDKAVLQEILCSTRRLVTKYIVAIEVARRIVMMMGNERIERRCGDNEMQIKYIERRKTRSIALRTEEEAENRDFHY